MIENLRLSRGMGGVRPSLNGLVREGFSRKMTFENEKELAT